MEKLTKYFGNAYHTVTQPKHLDFPLNWEMPETRLIYRAVFVGAKQTLTSPALTTEIPKSQARHFDSQA
jgi:hypothetical protein